jgi:two-component system, LytTR family, sensor kinase
MNKMILRPWFFGVVPLLVWSLLLVLPFLSTPPSVSVTEHNRFLTHVLVANVMLLAVFYIHTYLLYPLLKQKSLLLYIAALFVAIAAFWCISWFTRFVPLGNAGFNFGPGGPRHHFGPPLLGGPWGGLPIFPTIIVLLCSFCYRIILENAAREELLKEKETAHLRTELNFLRSQVNPHFLFNILNNLTSLARKKSDKLEPSIVSLSQLMRYMLYDSSDNKVPLAKEMEYLESYINLQKLRYGDELKVDVTFSINNNDCLVEPMLFIPLVENAFKYGTENAGDNLIMIDLLVPEDGSKLYFKVINFYDPDTPSAGKSTGIGLKNIGRRLELLYPDKYEFNISNNQKRYIAELTLQLK